MLLSITNTGDSTNFTPTILSGQVSGPPNNTTISSGVITDSNINTSVAIQNTKLATIQTVEKSVKLLLLLPLPSTPTMLLCARIQEENAQ